MWITIDRNINIPISRQIYNQIKHMILNSVLAENEKLISSRKLSKELDVSRNTVLEAYDQLIAEGYLIGNRGSGTVVARGISKYKIRCPDMGRTIIKSEDPDENGIIDFRSGLPDLTLFPRKEFGRLYQSVCNNLPEKALRYHSPAGVTELRQAITDYLFRTRGLYCDPNNLMIVSGSTQGLSLVSKLLYNNKKRVLAENPTHPGLINVISRAGFPVTGINVDDYGMNTDLLKPYDNIAFIYTTPSHQYPLGGILPIKRRLSLIRYAISNNCYIVEDDYDSEFRYGGQPVNSLCELNPQRVIYIGTFSKILSPSLRIGYLILPDELIFPYTEIKRYSDVHTESLSQYVLAKFIENGGLEKYIWKVKNIYSKKRKCLISELSKYFPGEFEIKGHTAGLHVIVKFSNVTFTKALVNAIYKNNVKVYPAENYDLNKTGNYKNEVLLGYAHLTFSEIQEGIRLLSQSISCSISNKDIEV
jgi:GntR family transcriptional regulator / MocR family aminotransferase